MFRGILLFACGCVGDGVNQTGPGHQGNSHSDPFARRDCAVGQGSDERRPARCGRPGDGFSYRSHGFGDGHGLVLAVTCRSCPAAFAATLKARCMSP